MLTDDPFRLLAESYLVVLVVPIFQMHCLMVLLLVRPGLALGGLPSLHDFVVGRRVRKDSEHIRPPCVLDSFLPPGGRPQHMARPSEDSTSAFKRVPVLVLGGTEGLLADQRPHALRANCVTPVGIPLRLRCRSDPLFSSGASSRQASA